MHNPSKVDILSLLPMHDNSAFGNQNLAESIANNKEFVSQKFMRILLVGTGIIDNVARLDALRHDFETDVGVALHPITDFSAHTRTARRFYLMSIITTNHIAHIS